MTAYCRDDKDIKKNQEAKCSSQYACLEVFVCTYGVKNPIVTQFMDTLFRTTLVLLDFRTTLVLLDFRTTLVLLDFRTTLVLLDFIRCGCVVAGRYQKHSKDKLNI